MFTEKQLERYADVLWWGLSTAKKVPFKKDDIVLIRYNSSAVRLAEVIYAGLLSRGMHPVQRVSPSATMEKDFYLRSSNRQLVFIPPGEKELMSRLNGSIYLHAPESITHLSDVAPQKIGKTTVAQKALRDILNRREARGSFSWTLCIFPTAELAGQAGLSLVDYTRQVAKACFLSKSDPLGAWRDIYDNARSIKKWLNSMKVKFLHVESDNIDLEITPGEKRRWIGISGRNIPSFEIFVSPDWRGTRGKYHADQPSYRSGNRVESVKLEFNKGKVIKVSAETGQEFVRKQLQMDKGADKVGEFSLTDRRFSRINRFMANTLFDENYGGKYGNCHIALGSSYSNTYTGDSKRLNQALKQKLGFNESALHWDLVNTEKKRVSAHLQTGKVITIYENGRFTC
ncbi:Aminopeptidase S (Leu, Val, Phe, Tyr preference) (EC [Olavius sp. associated proteobacterium Delta 1]|nr:Aminopeptidase S (Leu, Val, Phe, Tyr preference) (EC [Olavius sp. associated proteobacterium Delta 1]